MVVGWTQDDLLYGLPTDIRLKGSDINNDAILDYLLYRPSTAQFIYTPSGLTKDMQAGLATPGSYKWEGGDVWGQTPGAKPYFESDLAAQAPKGQHLTFGLSGDIPTTRQTASGTQVGITRGNDFYWLDMYETFLKPVVAGQPPRAAKIAQSYSEADEREKRVAEAARIGSASDARQKALQIEAEGRQDKITQAAEQRQWEFQLGLRSVWGLTPQIVQERLNVASEDRQQKFQLGLAPINYGGKLYTPQSVQNALTIEAERRQQEFQISDAVYAFQFGLAKASSDYSSTSPKVKSFQEEMARFSMGLQADLTGSSATRSEAFQLSAEQRQKDFQIGSEVEAFQKKLSNYSLGQSTKEQMSADAIAFQKSMSDYSIEKSARVQTGQELLSSWELQKEYSNLQTIENQKFQRGLQDQSRGYGSITSGSILASNPLSRYYQGSRQGMIKGFALGKANMSFRFNMPHREPGKNFGKSVADKFIMAPLNVKSSKVKANATTIPNFNYTEKGKRMAMAFGFTRVTPVAIVHAAKPMKINPPHRPKSPAKQMRVVVSNPVGRPKKRR